MVLDELQSEHITNLALFGLDRSDGELNWKWRSVGELISECNDPARPPVKGCNEKFFHWKLIRIVENISFRIFFLILLDISLVIAEIYISCSWNPVSIIIRHIDLILSIYFVIEVSLVFNIQCNKIFLGFPLNHCSDPQGFLQPCLLPQYCGLLCCHTCLCGYSACNGHHCQY